MKRTRSERIALERLQPWDIAETLLPEYTEQQYRDLEEFLANGGQLAPIVIADDGRIIDGYNRWRTARRLKLPEIECDVYEYDNQSEMEVHAIVLNAKRRHLSKLQVARAAVRLAALLTPEDEPVKAETEPVAEVEAAAENSGEESEVKVDVASGGNAVAALFQNEQAVREVSQKLGVAASVVKQVSKVDKSGDEMLITAMEDKVITIKQAAEIAELDEEFRRQAIEAIDEEKRKKNNYAGVFSRTCHDCLKKLQTSRNKFKDAEFSEAECKEMRSSIIQLIGEAKALMQMLSDKPAESAAADEAEDDSEEESAG